MGKEIKIEQFNVGDRVCYRGDEKITGEVVGICSPYCTIIEWDNEKLNTPLGSMGDFYATTGIAGYSKGDHVQTRHLVRSLPTGDQNEEL